MTDYATARERLREAELALMQQREAVAKIRRDLPTGPEVADYMFATPEGERCLTDLFSAPDRPLVLYHFMYGKAQTDPCPMCSMWADGWVNTAHHVAQTSDFAVVSAAPIDATVALAAERGWSPLQWLSSADSTFKADIGGEDADGNQFPFISVYELIDGRPHLSWSGGAHIMDEHWRGVDLFSPVWHFLDLTRSGRGDWMPGLAY